MKNINPFKIIIVLIILTLGVMALAHAQDRRFTLSAQTEFADKNTHNEGYDYGANIGVNIDYQMTLMYFNAGTYFFPGLNGMDYMHFEGTLLGFNHHSFNEYWRYYVGVIKGGFIFRDGIVNPMAGSDIGIEHYFGSGFFIGAETGYDWKMDDKVWDPNGTGHGVWFAAFKIGVTL